MNINLTTYLNQLGYGVAGLNILKALVRAGHTPALWINGPGQAPVEDRALVEQAVARTEFYDPWSPSLRVAHQWDMAHRVGRGVHAGLTFFELNILREAEEHHLAALDTIFVPTGWAAEVLAGHNIHSEKIYYAPLGVDHAVFHPQVEGGLPPGYEGAEKLIREKRPTIFLNCGKWEIRKGHDILIQAFMHAFSEWDNVVLIMNCANPFLTKEQQEEWVSLYRLSAPVCGKVMVLPERLSRQQDVARLMAVADCGVFPARAEGWNLEVGEMLAMGKHCIATNYSGHTEFCTPENCLLVEPDGMEPAFDGVFFKSGIGEWAELGGNAMEQLVAHMRAVHQRKQAGELGVNEAGIKTFRHFTWDNTVFEIMSAIA